MSNVLPAAEDHFGIVLVWDHRVPVGRYGYLTPFQFDYDPIDVHFFDESALASVPGNITSGSLVRYQLDKARKPERLINVRLETFENFDQRLYFSERFFDNVLPGVLGFLIDPLGPIFEQLQSKFSKRRLQDIIFCRDEMKRPDIANVYIARRFNALMRGPLIYDEDLFAEVKLRGITKKLLKAKPDGHAVRYLNRLLLEDAMASELPSTPAFVDSSPGVYSGKMGDYENLEQYVVQVRLDPQGNYPPVDAGFYRHSFPSDKLVPRPGASVECRVIRPQFQHQFGIDYLAYDIWQVASKSAVSQPSTDIQITAMFERLQELEKQLSQAGNLGFSATSSSSNDSASTKAKAKSGRGVKTILELPLKLDVQTRELIGKTKNRSRPLPWRLYDVMFKWLRARQQARGNNKEVAFKFERIGLLYLLGRERKTGNESENDLIAKIEWKERHKDLHQAGKFGPRFATDFSKWMKTHCGVKSDLIECLKPEKVYRLLNSGWDERPIVGDSEIRRIHVADSAEADEQG